MVWKYFNMILILMVSLCSEKNIKFGHFQIFTILFHPPIHLLHIMDNSSSVYTVQVIVAAILAIITGVTGFMAICREKLTTMKIYSFIMLLITFITGMGSFCLPNLVHWTNIILPLLGGGVSSLLSFVFSLLTQQQLDQEHAPSYQNYYPYNNPYN